MGLYNILSTTIECIHCKHESEFEIEFKNGFLDLKKYKLGDLLISNKYGKVDTLSLTEGYCKCSKCQKDFFVDIKVNENNIIESVCINKNKKGYIK